jgi:chemotaxis protein methyltransferase CheR
VTARGFSEPGFEILAGVVAVSLGLYFHPGRRTETEHCIRRAMAKAGINDVARYLAAVTAGEALDELVDELTVRETYFFREPLHLDVLRRRWLSEARSRACACACGSSGAARPISVWSAACASGEEAYSLAILFDEEGRAEAPGCPIQILATDVSRSALERAKIARYGQWSLRAAPPAIVERCFRQDGDGFLLDDRIRRRVTFARLNLASGLYPTSAVPGDASGFDLILCRNVLIHMDQASIRRVAARLYAALREGGWLVTGPSDPPLADLAPFELIVTEHGEFYRRVALQEGRS